ncbi:MAG: glucose-1-phosphate adenylyltransferase [Verrucomicrobia bacterium]|nr:glucose-1-phosphate adenylyltransferase [Verrucomicrobiota bacterium]
MPTSDLNQIALRSLAIIMGGGAGTRLYPLTKDRSKPAVPLGGKYRLVDIPISNCLNSGLRQIYVLTQFNTTSLHQHIHATYKFDQFSRRRSFVEILAAQQTTENMTWYQGTADAVRQNMRYFLEHGSDYYVILSGDQLYHMDYRLLLQQHIDSGADITLGTVPVTRRDAPGFGIMHSDDKLRIFRFEEKPKDPALLDELKIPAELLKTLGRGPDEELFQASMGIYVFNRQVLIDALNNDYVDFGKHIIPTAIKNCKVHAYIFQGYWEDIGTIRAFFEANLDLASVVPQYSFFERDAPIYTRPRFLPASKMNGAEVRNAIISDGCIVTDARIERCVIGIRSIIGSGADLRETVLMGADYYETDPRSGIGLPAGAPALGIGRNCVVKRAIIDKNVRIGDGAVVTPEGKPDNMDDPEGRFYIRDGVLVVPKGAIIAAGSWV